MDEVSQGIGVGVVHLVEGDAHAALSAMVVDLDDPARGLDRAACRQRKGERNTPSAIHRTTVILTENVNAMETQVDSRMKVSLTFKMLLDEEVDWATWATTLFA